MTMKPANLSLLKLSSISSRCLLRRSGQVEGRSFVTIFNPAAPKLKRLQRSPGFEAQTHPAESEKVSMLRKALEEAKIELEDVKTEAPTSSLNGIEKTVHVTKDSAVLENITKPESEFVDITEEKKNSNSADDSISAPNSDVTTPQKDTCEDTKKVQTETVDSESREANCLVQGKKKKLTKKAKKPISSTSNTDHTEDDDSSSSSSDSGTSSSSSDSSSDDEAEEKKPVKSARLNQVHFDSNPTLIHCLSFRKYFLIWPSCLMLSRTHP